MQNSTLLACICRSLQAFFLSSHTQFIMKVNLVALCITISSSSLLFATTVSGQDLEKTRVVLSLNHGSLHEALMQIERQSDFRFTYKREEITDYSNLMVEKASMTVKAWLDVLLQDTRLEYKQVGDYIVLKEKAGGDAIREAGDGVPLFTISGRVIDETGVALPGVNVIEKGTNNGTSADAEGSYIINVADEQSVLVFSFIGYVTQEVSLNGRSTIEVTMIPDVKSLGEVVVVGYGTLRSEDVTGSVATIDQKAIKDMPVSTIDQKMMGQVAGVQIRQLSGAPGAGSSVKIRGSGSLGAGNEPLYVVDGMPYAAGLNRNVNPLLLINPDDIESITVLKDASSTAIYGSRGANGVIMITTKKGNYDRTEVNVSSMVGVQQVPQKGRPDLLSQREFVELQRDKINIAVRRAENREATINDYPVEYQNPDQLVGDGTDWYDLLLQTALVRDHNISVSKGSKESRINFSLGYFEQEGTVRYTGVRRYSSKLGMESGIGKAVTVGASLQPAFIEQDRTNTNANREDILGVANWANPLLKPFDDQGQLIPYIRSPQSKYHSAWSFANPLFVLRETKQKEKQFQNLGIAFIEWDITPDLKARSSLNTIWSTSKFFQYIPSTVGGSNRPPVTGTGRSNNSNGEHFNWLIENTLTYNKTFNDHRLTALAGYTTQKSTGNSISVNAGPYANDLIETINAAQTISSWGQDIDEWSMISYLGRINYAFKDRYLLTATVRSDGSSRFGNENRYAVFPSIAGAWRVSEEEFLKNVGAIDDLKLRVSYGKSGNDNIGNYAHLAAINAGSYIFGNQQVTASFVGLSNPYLTWEESKQIDAGVDLEVFKNRVSLVVDYYRRESVNMLLNNVIPAITGFNNQTVNQGNVRNSGLEISLGVSPAAGDFNWDVNVNVAFNRNKILSLNDNGDRILAGNNDNNPTHISVVGKPIGQFFGYIFDGLYTEEDMADPGIIKTPQVYEGNVKYKDLDGDGIINDVLDYTIIGNPHPDFIFGFTNTFSYKGFNLNVILNGQYGGQVMNGLRQTVDNLQGFFNVSREWANRWRSREQPGDGKHYGVPKLTPSLGHRVSDLWVEDASFLRIANVTLGYSLPSAFITRTKFIKSCRIYVTAQNLVTFTNYGGANPEAQSVSISNILAPGFDMTSYPLVRTASLGINLSF